MLHRISSGLEPTSLTVPVDVKGGGEFFGSDPGQSTLVRGLQRHSLSRLRLPPSVAHPGRVEPTVHFIMKLNKSKL